MVFFLRDFPNAAVYLPRSADDVCVDTRPNLGTSLQGSRAGDSRRHLNNTACYRLAADMHSETRRKDDMSWHKTTRRAWTTGNSRVGTATRPSKTLLFLARSTVDN